MDELYSWLAFAAVAAAAWLVAAIVGRWHARWGVFTKRVILVGLFLRVVGAATRYWVFFAFYDGGGDAGVYYGAGLHYARQFWNLDFSIFSDPSAWWLGRFWGTQFVRFVSGFVVTLVGPSMRAEFLVFSLFAFAGLLLCGRAFHRSFPWIPRWRYLAWLLFWPSLWFWPSSVGKEAFILLCIGLTVAGHVGSGRRSNWPLLALGIGLAFCVRPHVAALLVGAVGASHWLTTRQIRTLGDLIRTVAVALLALFIGFAALQRLGIEQLDLEGVQEFMEHRAGLTATGGSAIGGSEGGLANLPMAFVNVLARPFPWEAHHGLALLSGLEMTLFWILVWRRRRRLRVVLRHWRKSRLLTMSAVFTVAYVLLIGMVFHNLGIIARQRVLVFPFLFVLLEARPRPQRQASVAGHRDREGRPVLPGRRHLGASTLDSAGPTQ